MSAVEKGNDEIMRLQQSIKNWLIKNKSKIKKNTFLNIKIAIASPVNKLKRSAQSQGQ